MAKAILLRSVLLSSLAAVAVVSAPTYAEAAGTIIIEQKSQIEQYGSWRLSTPAGMTMSQKKERIRSINAEQGQYLLNVVAPEGAFTTIRFYDGTTLLNTTEGTQIAFIFPGNGTLRAEISFRYEGIIVVESTPSGAHFELKGPQGVRQTGITPATFTQMPPLYFTASYSPLPGCLQPKPQGRVLRPNATLRFQADYTCLNEIKTVNNTLPPENGVPAPRASTPASERMLEEQSHANVQLFHSINQTETVVGSTVYVTLGVRNVSKTTLTNVVLSEQYDSEKVSLIGRLQGGGIIRGDTAMWDALITSIEMLNPLEGRKAIILLTDGMDNQSITDPNNLLTTIGESGLSISTIGFGTKPEADATPDEYEGIDEATLKNLAQDAGGIYGYAEDSETLLDLYDSIRQSLQSEVVISYITPQTLRDGVKRSLSVHLSGAWQTRAAGSSSSYNPGGLIPEVPEPENWNIFGILLGVLVVALVVPLLINRSKTKKKKKKTRIVLKD